MKFFKSEFSKNVLTLMTGTTFAQAIVVLIAPILTRLYSPEDFGILGIYLSITSILFVIINGRYEPAIMLPGENETAANLTVLSIVISITVSLLLLLAVLFFGKNISNIFDSPGLESWLYLIPVSTFFTGIYQALSYWSNRKKSYKRLAASKIAQSSTASAAQLGFGFLKMNGGLVTGAVLGHIASSAALMFQVLKEDLSYKKEISKERILEAATKYIEFPKFSIWGALINSLSFNVITLLIAAVFSTTIVGFYALINRVLALPSTIIGTSISQVYFEQASSEMKETGRASETFYYTLKKLFIIGVPIFIIIFLVVEDLFVIAFGSKWEEAGFYAKILLPFFLVRFISSTLSTTMTVFEKIKESLFVHISIIAASFGTFAAAYFFDLSFTVFLMSYSFSLSILYSLFLLYYYKLSKNA